MRQPHELLVDKFWLCHNSNLEVSAPMGSPSESRVCHRHEREAGWRAEDLIGGVKATCFASWGASLDQKKNAHMQNIAEHSIAILQFRIAEAQG